ncbi:MAG: AI-2E family transporter [Cytophagales bacterium]|nr:AI-2E family transporter [Bernardetiaceae bacterium]MDW8210823.1 AI-2E family transporter [Cytophagales bacterium]
MWQHKIHWSWVAVLVGIAAAVWIFSDIVLYIVLAAVLSSILKVPTNAMSQIQLGRVRIPRGIAILISFSILVGVLSLFILLFIPLINEQVTIIMSIPYDDFFDRIAIPASKLEDFLIKNNIVNEPRGFLILQLKNKMIEIFSRFNMGSAFNEFLLTTGNIFVGILAVLFITFFFLFEKGQVRKRIIALIPNRYFEVSVSAIHKIDRLLSNYLLGLLLQIISIFTIVSFSLILLGVNYAVTIGIFAAIINVIPFAGPLIGSIFGILVGISTASPELLEGSGYLWLFFKLLSVFVITQVIDNVILQPVIFSKSVKAHPLEIFISVFAGATLGGIWGMVAAIPAYTILRVSISEIRKGFMEYRIFKQKPEIQTQL